MTQSNQSARDENRRACERLKLHKKILLKLQNGAVIQGETEDISLRGMLLHTGMEIAGDLIGEVGAIYLIVDAENCSPGYGCRVVRHANQKIALELNRNAAAAFGKWLTKGL